MENTTDFNLLFQKLLDNRLSPEETERLMDWLSTEQPDGPAAEAIRQQLASPVDLAQISIPTRERLEHSLAAILAKETTTASLIKMQRRKSWLPWVAAASALFLLSSGIYFLVNNTTKQKIAETGQQQFKNDVSPGGNKATLTLANGSSIMLDSVHIGTIARQGSAGISKTDSGKLSYDRVNDLSAEVFYNVLTTPRGGQYQLQLPDGSQVWLNAASSIRYPTAFAGRERSVEITGEAYFEVAKDKAKPFSVSVNGMTVEVLGTHFNINSYADEETVSTTLIEGTVKVTKNNSSAILKPGEQSQLSGSDITVSAVDTDEVIAWKEGRFHFESADLKTILRQFARWYDVEVVYEGPVKNRKFFTIVSRASTLKNVLELLHDNDIVFRIEGKKLIVKSG